MGVEADQGRYKLKSRFIRQPQIDHCVLWRAFVGQLACRFHRERGLDLESALRKGPSECVAKRGVIVHQQKAGLVIAFAGATSHHPCASRLNEAIGNMTFTRVPPPDRSSQHSVPWSRSMARDARTTPSPVPLPGGLVVKNVRPSLP